MNKFPKAQTREAPGREGLEPRRDMSHKHFALHFGLHIREDVLFWGLIAELLFSALGV